MTIRPYRSTDREQVLAFLGDARAVDGRGQHVRVVDEGGVVGVATGTVADGGTEARLGVVLLRDGRRWDLFHELIASLVERAIGLGFTVGSSETRSRRVVRHLRQTFGLDGQAAGREPESGRVLSWRYEVDLVDFLAQLRAVM